MYRLVFLIFAVFAINEAMARTLGHRRSHHAKTVGTNSVDCEPDQVECLTGEYAGDCIPAYWVCDVWNDCGDASDEDLSICPPVVCNGTDIKCPTTNLCIPTDWICDEWDDCGDNWDEMQNCPEDSGSYSSGSGPSGSQSGCDDFVNKALLKQALNKKRPVHLAKNGGCSGDEVECPAGSPAAGDCIPDDWFCDEWNDCGDASDESTQAPMNCDLMECDGDCEFTCLTTNLCIPHHWVCDGDNDCGDHSDEENCPRCRRSTNKELLKEALNKKRTNLAKAGNCPSGEGECPAGSPDAGECIPNFWFCDEWNDCGDGSDESDLAPVNCPTLTCDLTCEFSCASTNICIPQVWECDGDNDCGDSSDEQNCRVTKSKARKLWSKSWTKTGHKG